MLYIWYYPARLRVLDSELDLGRVRMSEWKFSVFCAWILAMGSSWNVPP